MLSFLFTTVIGNAMNPGPVTFFERWSGPGSETAREIVARERAEARIDNILNVAFGECGID